MLALIKHQRYAHFKPGDAFCFRSHIPHSYLNSGKERASILWTCTPPTF